MSLTAEEKQVMRDLHLSKASTCLQDADSNFANGALSTAANRYYYAVLHAVHALFVTDGCYSRTHNGLIALFSLHYIQTGLFDTKFGRFISVMENLRDKADYDVMYDVTVSTLSEIQPLTRELIQAVQVYLSTKSTE